MLSKKGADVRDVFSCVAPVYPLQEHGHIDGQVNDFSINVNIVVAKDNSLRDIILCVAQDIVQCQMEGVVLAALHVGVPAHEQGAALAGLDPHGAAAGDRADAHVAGQEACGHEPQACGEDCKGCKNGEDGPHGVPSGGSAMSWNGCAHTRAYASPHPDVHRNGLAAAKCAEMTADGRGRMIRADDIK